MAKRGALLVAILLVGTAPAHAAPRPPGTLVFFSHRNQGGGLYAESAAGGPLRMLRTGLNDVGVFWSPNGKRYLFEAPGTPVWQSDLWIADADGRHRRLVAKNAPQPSWAPSGREIAVYRDGALWVVRADGRGAHQLTSPGQSDGTPRWSPDGRLIAFLRTPGGPNSTLMAIRPNGTGLRRIADRVFFPPSWSPDGKRIAFDSSGPGGTGPYEPRIYVADPTGKHLRRVLGAEVNGFVTWSPNGRWLAFGGAGTSSISAVRPDGSGLRRLLDNAGFASNPTWAPDSRRLALALGTPADVWVVGLDGRSHRVTQGWRYGYTSYSPSWQPRNLAPRRLGGTIVSPAIPTESVIAGGVLESARPVDALGADGTRAVVAYGPGASPGCIETWDARTTSIVRYNECGYQKPALAGERVALPEFEHALGTNSYGIGLATVDRPNPAWVTGLCPSGSSQFCIRDPVGDVVGKGSLLVFDSWKGPEPYCNEPCPPPKHDSRLFRVDNGAAVQIATSTGELTPLAIDSERILVDEGPDRLAILDSAGGTLLTLAAPGHGGARLEGSDLVVQTGLMLADYDANNGALLHAWPTAADATLEDVQDGTAVYVTPTRVHLLHLADGRDVEIDPHGRGPLHAQLEPAGLFYSYAVEDGVRPGRVGFVASTALP
jgi:Tol biopolymer transport system component